MSRTNRIATDADVRQATADFRARKAAEADPTSRIAARRRRTQQIRAAQTNGRFVL